MPRAKCLGANAIEHFVQIGHMIVMVLLYNKCGKKIDHAFTMCVYAFTMCVHAHIMCVHAFECLGKRDQLTSGSI